MLKCQQMLAFYIYEQDKFRAQLSWAWKKFYNLRAWLSEHSLAAYAISMKISLVAQMFSSRV